MTALFIDQTALDCGISTRLGGVSRPPYAELNLGSSTDDDPRALAENRRRFAAAADLDLSSAARMRQVHGGEVLIARRAGLLGDADGLVTDEPARPLLVTVADCLPVFLHEPVAGLIGALHAGWRGIVAGVLENGVARIRELGGRPERLRIAIGPGIGPCCFEVGPEVGGRFAAAERHGRHVDLGLAARRRLSTVGVPEGAVEGPIACTRCHTDRYFSARNGEPTGRMVGFIVQRAPCRPPS